MIGLVTLFSYSSRSFTITFGGWVPRKEGTYPLSSQFFARSTSWCADRCADTSSPVLSQLWTYIRVYAWERSHVFIVWNGNNTFLRMLGMISKFKSIIQKLLWGKNLKYQKLNPNNINTSNIHWLWGDRKICYHKISKDISYHQVWTVSTFSNSRSAYKPLISVTSVATTAYLTIPHARGMTFEFAISYQLLKLAEPGLTPLPKCSSLHESELFGLGLKSLMAFCMCL